MGSFREQWVGLGTELVVRATRGICAGSVLNAEIGRAVTRARIEDWAGVLSLYEPQLSLVEPRNESVPVRATA
jgi:hypothetical protein